MTENLQNKLWANELEKNRRFNLYAGAYEIVKGTIACVAGVAGSQIKIAEPTQGIAIPPEYATEIENYLSSNPEATAAALAVLGGIYIIDGMQRWMLSDKLENATDKLSDNLGKKQLKEVADGLKVGALYKVGTLLEGVSSVLALDPIVAYDTWFKRKKTIDGAKQVRKEIYNSIDKD